MRSGCWPTTAIPDAFVDLLYVADETDAHLEWVERLLAK